MAHENLFSFYVISGVKVVIDSSAIESSPRHVLAPSAHIQVIVRELLILAMDLRDKALHNRNAPAERKLVPGKYLE